MPYLDQKKKIYKYFTKFDLMVYGRHYNVDDSHIVFQNSNTVWLD